MENEFDFLSNQTVHSFKEGDIVQVIDSDKGLEGYILEVVAIIEESETVVCVCPPELEGEQEWHYLQVDFNPYDIIKVDE